MNDCDKIWCKKLIIFYFVSYIFVVFKNGKEVWYFFINDFIVCNYLIKVF